MKVTAGGSNSAVLACATIGASGAGVTSGVGDGGGGGGGFSAINPDAFKDSLTPDALLVHLARCGDQGLGKLHDVWHMKTNVASSSAVVQGSGASQSSLNMSAPASC
jgi:hypothetical protein